jgi:voltage-gated potassium channel
VAPFALLSFLQRLLAQRALWAVAAVTAVIVPTAGLAVHLVEPDRFDSVFDGVWWAATTVTTVGYGDLVPETGAGRAVGFALMFSGAGLFAAVAAIVAAVLVVEEVEAEEHEIESQEAEILVLLTRLEARLARLERSVIARAKAEPE